MPTYVKRNGEKLGPFEDAQLLSSLQQGIFSYDDLALRDGWTDWKPLRALFAPPSGAASGPHTAHESAIAAPEHRVWSGRPSHWHFFWSWVIAFILLVAQYYGCWFYFHGNPNPLLFAPGLITVVIVVCIYISRARQLYVVTNRKVEIQTGLLVKSSNEIRVKDIRSINVRKHGIAGFAGVGRVEFSSAATDDAEVTFMNIPHADKVRDLVSSLQES